MVSLERLICLSKQALYKLLGKRNLNWNDLEEVLLNFECNMNNRPLIYNEVNIQYPAVTPHIMILGGDTTDLDEDPEYEDESEQH